MKTFSLKYVFSLMKSLYAIITVIHFSLKHFCFSLRSFIFSHVIKTPSKRHIYNSTLQIKLGQLIIQKDMMICKTLVLAIDITMTRTY